MINCNRLQNISQNFFIFSPWADLSSQNVRNGNCLAGLSLYGRHCKKILQD